MRINHLSLTAEFRKQRDSVNTSTGEVSRYLTFEDSDCNTFDVVVRDSNQFALCNGLTKSYLYNLELAFVSGTSRSGNHYEMLSPACPDFCVSAD